MTPEAASSSGSPCCSESTSSHAAMATADHQAPNPSSPASPSPATTSMPTWSVTDSDAVPYAVPRAASPTEEPRRMLPHHLSVACLDSAADAWASSETCDDSSESAAPACDNAEGDGDEDDDACIPYDYESEMEECSQYTFSSAPYSPSTTAALAAVASTASPEPYGLSRPATPRAPSVLALPRSAAAARTPEPVPLSPQWCERQRRDNATHHAGTHYAWQQGLKQAAAASPANMRYALRSLLREACCRELKSLRSQPALSFVRMDPPQSGSRSRSSLRASCMLASATSAAQRKECFIEIITEHWRALEARLEEMLADTEKESVAAGESQLRSVGYALNALSLFSNDPQHIIREMNMGHVEEQRRHRHDREAQLLMTLESQGRLFVLPTLYAEEVEEPLPILRIDAALSSTESAAAAAKTDGSASSNGNGNSSSSSSSSTPSWQYLTADAYFPSSASSSTSPTPEESLGALSPCSSGCMSATCSPLLEATSPSADSTRPLASRPSIWKDLQPPRLPLLDLFMTAPAVVPSTVVADSEGGVPFVMPVDPSYVLHEMQRHEAAARAAAAAAADPLSSPQLSGALVRGGVVPHGADDHRHHPLLLDGADETWADYMEQDVFDYAETVKLGETDVIMLSFDVNAVTAPTSGVPLASPRQTLTDG